MSHLPDGSYTAMFPRKPSHSPLPTNYTLCEQRTQSLIDKLLQPPLASYHLCNEQVMQEEHDLHFLLLHTAPCCKKRLPNNAY